VRARVFLFRDRSGCAVQYRELGTLTAVIHLGFPTDFLNGLFDGRGLGDFKLFHHRLC
jgi:hypothetical protein